jgi:AcrR family transcriptional regulator
VARPIPPDRFPALIRAAAQVFLELGYRRAQMADVAARLGVSKGTLYLYVESKEALFDLALRHADDATPPPLPPLLPVPTPEPGATLLNVEKRISEEAALPVLRAALARGRVRDARAEAEGIAREIYALLARHRVAIKLLDRCALDYPGLAAVWYRTGREGLLALLEPWLADRMRRGRLRRYADVAVVARLVLETLTYWAVHRHWDPSPQALDEAAVEDSVVAFVVGALVEE